MPCRCPCAERRRGRCGMSVDPTRYAVGPDAVIEEVDLDEEDVRLPDGTRLTEQRAGQLARVALAEIRRRNLVPGRKSLSGGVAHSPRVQFRVPEGIRERADTA